MLWVRGMSVPLLVYMDSEDKITLKQLLRKHYMVNRQASRRSRIYVTVTYYVTFAKMSRNSHVLKKIIRDLHDAKKYLNFCLNQMKAWSI